jgi:hypothetical protein
LALGVFQGQRVGGIEDGRFRIQDFENSNRRSDGTLHRDMHPAQGFDRLIKEKDAAEQGDEFGCRQALDINVEESQSHTHGGDRFDQRAHRFHRAQNTHRIGKLRLIAPAKVLFLLLLSRKGFDDSNPSEALLHRHDHLGHALLFAVDRLARPLAIHAERYQAAREKHQRDNGKFPIHVEQNGNAGDNRNRLPEEVAADAGESGLHHPGIVGDLRH